MIQARALPVLFLVGSFALFACGDGGRDTTTTSAASTSANVGSGGASPAATTDVGATTGAGGSGGTAPTSVKTLSGDVTWQLTFDADAKTAGATDCSYTRHYEAVEDTSAPWLCPDCDTMFQADVVMTSGQADCYSQLSTTAPATKEWIAYGNGTWWRSLAGPMSAQGMTTLTATTITTASAVAANPVTAGGTVDFAVAGSLAFGEKEGDPLNGFVPPATYACGFSKADPAPYTGNYAITKGGVLPDGLFKDKCGETVRLQDFAGTYLIVDMAAMDCGPCQLMASQEEQFIADMAAKGIQFQVITLLCPSLSNIYGDTTTANLNTWINNFHLTTPVLGDRGWGMATMGPVLPGIGYPAWTVVGPDLKVLDYQTGYPSTLADLETIVTADVQ